MRFKMFNTKNDYQSLVTRDAKLYVYSNIRNIYESL